jgi:hypothetical protein
LSGTISRWQRRSQGGRFPGLFAASRPRRRAGGWATVVVGWVLDLVPTDFGFARRDYLARMISTNPVILSQHTRSWV